jgi:hypothetical protein
MELLGDAPGDRLVVGDAGDEGLLAAQVEEHGEERRRRRWCADRSFSPSEGEGLVPPRLGWFGPYLASVEIPHQMAETH